MQERRKSTLQLTQTPARGDGLADTSNKRPFSFAAKPEELVQIHSESLQLKVKPSRYNARSVAEAGDLILYNSYSGALSGFRPSSRSAVEALLKKGAIAKRDDRLVQYLLNRGFLVPAEADEFARFRNMYGRQQHRNDALELILLASEECNFRCVYCYETFPRQTMEPWVRDSLKLLVDRRARRLSRLNVSWFGGEPLLGLEAIRDLAPSLLRTSKQHDVAYRSDMTTNGFLLNQDTFASLLEWKVTGFQITLDGDAESHDCKRILRGGGDTYQTIMNNLKATRSFKEKFGITIRINYDQKNIHTLEAFTEELKETFGSDHRYQIRFYPVGQWGGANDPHLEVCGIGRAHTQDLQLMASSKGASVESPFATMQPSTGLGVCYAARPYNLLIGADGKIMKCTIALDTRDHNIVGKLTRDGRAELDQDKLVRWTAPYYEDDPACKSCFYVPVCQGCSCPLVRIESDDRPCPSEKAIISKTLRTVWSLQQQRANKFDLNTSTLTRATGTSVES